MILAFEETPLRSALPLEALLRRIGRKEFSGGEKQVLVMHTAGQLPCERLILAGLGRRSKATRESLRRAVGRAIKTLQNLGLSEAGLDLVVDLPGVSPAEQVQAAVEASLLAAYQFTRFKADGQEQTEIRALTICPPRGMSRAEARRTVQQAEILASSVNEFRELGNLPGNVVSPAVLADRARRLARECGLSCTVWDKQQLRRHRCGGLLAVGGGSANDPRLIALEYRGDLQARRAGKRPAAKGSRPIALVGKAITFDSGGLSIKPSEKMDEMKFDKCGGVAVLGTLSAAARLKLPIRLLGVIAAAENLPGARSYRPGDIVTSYRGREKRAVTIEVLNTDAEGRIVLGDALAYACQQKPRAVIDLATLTGACVVALGPFAAGLMSNDESLENRIRAAGDRTGERVWPLPLWPDHREKVKSDVADIKNTAGREAGAITAAAFLARYVGDIPWAHLDIAGTASTKEDQPYLRKGATGFGIRLLTDLLSRWH